MWKLVNFKIPLDVLERIDAEARKANMTRTAYVVMRCDPALRLTVGDVIDAASYKLPPLTDGHGKPKPIPSSKPRQTFAGEPAPFKSRLKGEWKAP